MTLSALKPVSVIQAGMDAALLNAGTGGRGEGVGEAKAGADRTVGKKTW